jgi:hypothetical protein
MLDPWIIEEILKREEDRRRESERERIEIPVEGPTRPPDAPVVTPPRQPHDDGQRGVMIIDI